MTILDKIYVVNILEDSASGDSWGSWSGVEVEGTLNIEYIRKDVVDEMLKTAEDHAYFSGSEAMRNKMLEMKDVNQLNQYDYGRE